MIYSNRKKKNIKVHTFTANLSCETKSTPPLQYYVQIPGERRLFLWVCQTRVENCASSLNINVQTLIEF